MDALWIHLCILCILTVNKTKHSRLTNPNLLFDMLNWTLTFLIIAIIAAILGFGGIAGAAAGIAKILFFVFLVLLFLSLLTGLFRR